MAKRRTREQIAADLEFDRGLAAKALAIAGCVVRQCPDHEDTWVRVEGRDIRLAFEEGYRMFKVSGHLKHFFATRALMEEAVRRSVLQHPTRCPLCEPSKPN